MWLLVITSVHHSLYTDNNNMMYTVEWVQGTGNWSEKEDYNYTTIITIELKRRWSKFGSMNNFSIRSLLFPVALHDLLVGLSGAIISGSSQSSRPFFLKWCPPRTQRSVSRLHPPWHWFQNTWPLVTVRIHSLVPWWQSGSKDHICCPLAPLLHSPKRDREWLMP